MLRYDEESQFLDEDVPRITNNIGVLLLMLSCAVVGIVLVIALLMWLV